MSDGSLSIRTRIQAKKSLAIEAPTYDALLAGKGGGGVVYSGKEAMEGLVAFQGEKKVGKERKKKLMEWDRMLKDFRYGDALDSVLRVVRPPPLSHFSRYELMEIAVQGVTAATSFALLTELIHRNGLPIALANRQDLTLEPILKFLIKHITSPRYCITAADVAHSLLEIYSSTLGLSPLVDRLMGKLARRVEEEVEFQRELEGMRGALEMVFAGSQLKV